MDADNWQNNQTMSKIIILAEPAEGHINPFMPIMVQLIARGHEVVCITGEKFRPRVEKIGAVFQALPEKWDPKEQETYDFFPELRNLKGLAQIKYYLKHIMYDQVPDVLACLRSVLKDFPANVIISDTFMLGGNWITELGGPPSVRLSVLPLSLPEKDIAPFGLGLLPGYSWITKLRNNILSVVFEKILFKDVQNYANTIRKRVGLAVFDQSFFIKGYQVPNLVLHTSTPQFEYARKTYPANFRFIGPVLVPPNEQFMQPEWWPILQQDLPVVLITQGTVAKNQDDLIMPAITALKNEKVIVVVVPVNEGDIKNLPDNTYTAPYFPIGNLLPHIDIMISNGGFGGTQHALAHGIPVIITGATEDKMEVAARVEYSGAGINLGKQKVTSEMLKKAVTQVLNDPSFKQKAQVIQADFAQYDAPLLAVSYIENLIEETQT